MPPGLIFVLTAFFLAVALVFITVPPIVRVAGAKNLFDETGGRKVHRQAVPVAGGVAIFIAFTVSTIISTNGYDIDSLKYILAAIIILFFTGLKDDILVIAPSTKFLIQLVAALLVIILGNIRITHFQLVFRIQEIGYPFSLFITLLLIMGIVNAYNFIDGIDGLASGLGLMSSAVFGSWFCIAGDAPYAIMSFALCGSLAGYFYFNVFGKKNKLFMGDAGSLIIGLISAVLVVRFVEMNRDQTAPFALQGSPAVAFAILLVPLVDLTRVFFLRISRGKSPFYADNNHIHHRLLRLIRSHFRISLLIVAVNSAVIALSFLFSRLGMPVNLHLLVLLLLGIVLSLTPVLLYGRKLKRGKVPSTTGKQ